jgi:hypothetical protein
LRALVLCVCGVSVRTGAVDLLRRGWDGRCVGGIAAGLFADVGTLHLDRGHDSGAVRSRLAGYHLTELEIQRRGTRVPGVKK